jgi:hypothetical protein
VRVLILASSITDNTPNGYYWTFLFPMLLFIAIAVALYLLFSRPHRRIPARAIQLRGASRAGAVPSYPHGATAVSAAPAPTAEAGSAAEPEVSEGEQAEGDAASAGDEESGE